MSTIPRKFFTILSVLALIVAQLAGLPGGWICACSDEPVVVTEQWCSGEECHEGHSSGDHGHSPVEHREVRESLTTVAAAPLHFVPPVLTECPLPVPAELGIRLAESCEAELIACHPCLEDPGGRRPKESYARRTAVLLI